LVPASLNSPHPQNFKPWVAEEWTTLPKGVLPATSEIEEKIVMSLISELSDYFQIELGKEPIFGCLDVSASEEGKPALLMISSSHSKR